MKPDEHSERREEKPKVNSVELQLEEFQRRLLLSERTIGSDATQCLVRADKNGENHGAKYSLSGNARLPKEVDEWLDESVRFIRTLVIAADRIPGDPPVARVLRQKVYLNNDNPSVASAVLSLETEDRRSAIFYDDQIQVLPKGTAASMFVTNYRTLSTAPFASEPVFGVKAADVVLGEVLTKALSPTLTYPAHRGYGDFVIKSAINRITNGPPESLRQILIQRIEFVKHLRQIQGLELARQLKVMTQNGEFFIVTGFDIRGRVTSLFD